MADDKDGGEPAPFTDRHAGGMMLRKRFWNVPVSGLVAT
jgi:hypothetical protein